MTFSFKIGTTRNMKRLILLILMVPNFALYAQMREGLTFGRSIEEVSAQFLGTPYCGGPLGEGPEARYDQDPRCTLDKFDCQTFVETVIAFQRSQSSADVLREMDAIRYYKSIPKYEMRLHFVEMQWVPQNIENGYIKDITDLFLPCREGTTCLDIKEWYHVKKMDILQVPSPSQELLDELKALADHSDSEDIPMTYLPIANLTDEILDQIPSGSIVLFLKKNNEPSLPDPFMVYHMGFVIDTTNGKVLRHATPQEEYNSVVDMDLKKFIKERFKARANAFGIKVLQPIVQKS